ncbi:Gfo/Idh/MocA family protein [Methylophaga sp. OBS4]|uniref:Gfo/Idh/MocA family protein n=1 Tax=Methylophaga sp. OBS4 TaxID=2991935 RepID=UPI00225495A4|nr:Gfo/Idh/MocA family oxidoreductase [Methylophaga sp. OBS4]MCX4187363.1 Gfo/Idh/MocA family oxidoreductase [Methylophaga sp. OBS4]
MSKLNPWSIKLSSHQNLKSSSPLRLAFIGGGTNSAVGRVHKIAAEMDNRFKLVAGCFSMDKDINLTSAHEYGLPESNCYPSLSTLLANESALDAIAVLTPTPNHTTDVIACLQANVPVICEKALTNSVTDAEAIKAVLHRTNGFLSVTYNYTGYPMLRELKSLISQGRIGKIEQLHVEMPQEGFARLDKNRQPVIPQAWRLEDKELPTLSLDLGVHVHHLISFLTEEAPIEVVATESSFGSFRQVIDNTICIARYSDDIICNIWYSKAALGHRNGLRIRVYGSEGAAEWFQADPENLLLHDNTGQRLLLDRAHADVELAQSARYNRFKAGHPAGFIEAFANHYSDIAEALTQFRQFQKHDNQYVFGIEDAFEGLKLLHAVHTSSETKNWVAIT